METMDKQKETISVIVVVLLVIVGALYLLLRSNPVDLTAPQTEISTSSSSVARESALKAEADKLNPINKTKVNPFNKETNPYKNIKTNPFQ